MCETCRERYGSWSSKSLIEKVATIPPRRESSPTGRMLWMPRSGNAKLGGIPASMSERGTCPPSCGLYEAGCYAGYGKLGAHWKRVGERGLSWTEFLARVRSLPEGRLWRHNVAGDLPGDGEMLDVAALNELVEANRGRRGFTFTHKTHPALAEATASANARGFAINLSADTLEQADEFAGAGAPVAVLLPHDAPDRGIRTPAGRRVTVCPAETSGLTCADCELCAKADRVAIIGFRAHGQFKRHVPELIQLRRKERTA
jgi:hypothetical protein